VFTGAAWCAEMAATMTIAFAFRHITDVHSGSVE